MIPKTVKVIVDCPIGSFHPEYKNLCYPINYGYIEGIIAPDGEEQDAYILGIYEPVCVFVGKVIAVIHRKNDIEDKWVVSPEKMSFAVEDIKMQVEFQEKYFEISIELIDYETEST